MMSLSIVPQPVSKVTWQWLTVATLGFWLSGSLLIDLVMMPTMAATGMMQEPGFASAGYALFWVFNRIELVCAALILTAAFGRFVLASAAERQDLRSLLFAALLFDIALLYTYALTPHMSALGLSLNLFAPAVEPPAAMNLLHLSYWVLELLKLTVGALLLKLCFHASTGSLLAEP